MMRDALGRRTSAARCTASLVGAIVLSLTAEPVATAAGIVTPACVEFDTELTSLNLTGGPFPLPVASDPTNALGDSINGYGLVHCSVSIALSSQRTPAGMASLGHSVASNVGQGGQPTCSEPVDANLADGQQFSVDSFFDVFFDITITDVDPRPGRDIGMLPDGASFSLRDNGPARMQSFFERIFDKSAPNFGLVPPPAVSPYIGHFGIEIPLGVDINGNGELDKVKFTLAAHSVSDANRTFVQLPNGTVLDTFDSEAFLEGAVVDVSTDPPFTIGMVDPATGLPVPGVFGGPTTASSVLGSVVLPLDHFLFYRMKTTKGTPKPLKIGPVVLADQFAVADYDVKQPKSLGLPADKNGEGYASPLGAAGIHLERFVVKRSKGQLPFSTRSVQVVNQCSNVVLDVLKPDSLLVPTTKDLAAPAPPLPAHLVVDHFLCYTVRSRDFPKGMQVVVTDQFDGPQRRYDLKKITRLCNPADKSGSPVVLSGPTKGAPFPLQPAAVENPAGHLVCYKAKLATAAIPQAGCGAANPGDKGTKIEPRQPKHARVLGVFVGNQLAAGRLDSASEEELCIPSEKTIL